MIREVTFEGHAIAHATHNEMLMKSYSMEAERAVS
jgi:hypothetical protein